MPLFDSLRRSATAPTNALESGGVHPAVREASKDANQQPQQPQRSNTSILGSIGSSLPSSSSFKGLGVASSRSLHSLVEYINHPHGVQLNIPQPASTVLMSEEDDNINQVMSWNIWLVGPPGAGKTTVAPLVAKRMKKCWYDFTDHHLEKVVWKRPVGDVLKELGDDGYIAAEADAMRVLNVANTVVSLSGSVPLVEKSMRICRALGGPIVYLDPDLREMNEHWEHGPVVGWRADESLVDCLIRRAPQYEKTYDMRVAVTGRTPEDIADEILYRIGRYTWMISTRGGGSGRGVDFLQCLRGGLAPCDGLFVPNRLPTDCQPFFRKWIDMRYYAEFASRVMEVFLDYQPYLQGVSPQELRRYAQKAYNPSNWSNPHIVPITRIHEQDIDGVPLRHRFLMELTHGPTGAFQDISMQFLPKLFTRSLVQENAKHVVIMATSGHSGAAAIAGFIQEVDVMLYVLFPLRGVSAVNQTQMLSFNGFEGRIRVMAVDGDFEFCQSVVKQLLSDEPLAKELREHHDVMLSTANSVNWGRLLPQVVCYFWGYLQLVKTGRIRMREPINICVPSGNFGIMLGAYMAKRMGLPVKKLVCASGERSVLTEFIRTGVFDIRSHTANATAPEIPGVDILWSANIERLLFWITDQNVAEVRSYMHDLETKKRFEVSAKVKELLDDIFWAGKCSEEQARNTIKELYEQTGHLIDPHTAVGYKVLGDFETITYTSEGRTPFTSMLASTAHWSKSPQEVAMALREEGRKDEKFGHTIQGALKAFDSLADQFTLGPTTEKLRGVVTAHENIEPKTIHAEFGAIAADLMAFCSSTSSS